MKLFKRKQKATNGENFTFTVEKKEKGIEQRIERLEWIYLNPPKYKKGSSVKFDFRDDDDVEGIVSGSEVVDLCDEDSMFLYFGNNYRNYYNIIVGTDIHRIEESHIK